MCYMSRFLQSMSAIGIRDARSHYCISNKVVQQQSCALRRTYWTLYISFYFLHVLLCTTHSTPYNMFYFLQGFYLLQHVLLCTRILLSTTRSTFYKDSTFYNTFYFLQGFYFLQHVLLSTRILRPTTRSTFYKDSTCYNTFYFLPYTGV